MGQRLRLTSWWLLLLLGSATAQAQPALRLRADSLTARPGDTVAVAVRMSGFRQMLTAQGTLAFDSTVVEAVGVLPGALAGLSSANFGQLGRAYLTFAWFDPAVSGQSLPDSAVLFVVRYRVVGGVGQRSAFRFTDAPTIVEFTRVGFQAVVPVRIAGVVRIGNPTGAPQDSAAPSTFGFFPNPATGWLTVAGAATVWLTETASGRRHLLRPAPDGHLDLRSWPPGYYLLAPDGAGGRPRPLVLVR